MRRVLLALALVLPLTACGGGEERQTLTVLAAASLTETFTELAETFEDEHPDVDVRLVLGSSTTLADQAVDGAPGDVLATADSRAMTIAVDGGLAAGPEPFALNELVIVTPPGNPAGVTGLGSLARPGVDWARCVSTAPCGALAESALARRSSGAEPVTEEVDVKAVLARVVAGEVDAGLVYRTDALAAGDEVETVEAEPAPPSTVYEVATLDDGAGAADFVELVLSDRGQAVLREAGFQAPRTFGDDG